jgi:hypothetical protein
MNTNFKSLIIENKKLANELIIANKELTFQNEKKDKRATELVIANKELQLALSEIKSLKSILPICSQCKNIRDDKGSWNILEKYISEHTNSNFSHTICPECADKLYRDDPWYQDYKKKKTT